MPYIKRVCLSAFCLALLSACGGGSGTEVPTSQTETIGQEIGKLTLKAWVDKSTNRVNALADADGVEFFRTTDADCDLANYATCTNGQMDILRNGVDLSDTAFLLDQPAYYTLTVDNDRVSLPVSARHFNSRADHEVTPFKGKLWVFGGVNGGGRNQEIWSSIDGHTWVLEAPYGSFERRQNHKVVEFKGKLWMFGGAVGTGFSPTFYSSEDGIHWEYEGLNRDLAKAGHELVVFQDKLWLIGGHDQWVWRGEPDLDFFENEVWTSEDGVNWSRVRIEQPFTARSEFGLAVFNDKMWIVGGLTLEGAVADVWSSTDGSNWTQSPATGFQGRMEHQLTVFDNKLWMTGGRSSHDNDTSISESIYSSADGETWTQVDASSDAPQRYGHGTVAWNGELWMIGGNGTVDGKDDVTGYLGGVWHSQTGSDWTRADPGTQVIEPVYEHQMVEFNEKLWIIGEGSDFGDKASGVWYSDDGLEWTAAESDIDFSELHGHQVVAFNDKLWVIAGEDREYRSTIWSSSDGVAWTVETTEPGFPARKGHQVTAFKGALWLTGGQMDSVPYADVWSSTDGVTWTENVSESQLGKRYLHQMAEFDDKLWVLGGKSEEGMWRDIWFSEDGSNWVLVGGRRHYVIREGHQLVAFDDKLLLMGGRGEWGDYLNDIWYLTRESDWTEMTNTAPFSGRIDHQLVAFDEYLILSGGRNAANQRGLADVWRTTNGLDWQRAYLRRVNAD